MQPTRLRLQSHVITLPLNILLNLPSADDAMAFIHPSQSPNQIAAATLARLETRLRRLEFVLGGESDGTGVPTPVTSSPKKSEETIAAKLQGLEKGLRRLKERNAIVRDVLVLNKRHPGVFAGEGVVGEDGGDEETKRAIVLSHASGFYELAARGTRLRDMEMEGAIPSAELSKRLVELGPRLEGVMGRLEGQRERVGALRARSVRVIERGVRGVVRGGEEWVEWEGRVRGVGREVGRVEGRRGVEDG